MTLNSTLESTPPEHSFFSEEELSILESRYIPKHVAIIMDGNRRWAKSRNLPPHTGHWRGADTLTHIVSAASELGIKSLTVFGFSTENWKRSQEEIDTLMHLIKIYLIKQRESMVKEGVRLDTIGDLNSLPQDVQKELETTKKMTAASNKIDLILALNYGGRDEIIRAVKTIVADCLHQNLDSDSLSESTFANYLDTAKWEDPQLIIRTSGEMRLSNFLIWQASYAEVHITEVLWPDFTSKDLLQALVLYQNRERRIGI